jgi:hypothetical protein
MVWRESEVTHQDPKALREVRSRAGISTRAIRDIHDKELPKQVPTKRKTTKPSEVKNGLRYPALKMKRPRAKHAMVPEMILTDVRVRALDTQIRKYSSHSEREHSARWPRS